MLISNAMVLEEVEAAKANGFPKTIGKGDERLILS